MSIEEHIVNLELLAEADAAIKELTIEIEQERGAIDDVREELGQIEERLGGDRQSVAEMDKTRTDLVQEIRQIGGQIERSRERLQRARNEREVNAAEREMDELRKLQRDRDDEIKKLVTLSDLARQSIDQGEGRMAELNQRLSGSLEGKTESIRDLEGKRDALTAQRTEVARKLPRRVSRRYEMVHKRGKVPVAKTHDGTCLGCHVKLPPMVFHRMLSRTEFEECPTCHRIIYYTPPPPPAEDADEGAAS